MGSPQNCIFVEATLCPGGTGPSPLWVNKAFFPSGMLGGGGSFGYDQGCYTIPANTQPSAPASGASYANACYMGEMLPGCSCCCCPTLPSGTPAFKAQLTLPVVVAPSGSPPYPYCGTASGGLGGSGQYSGDISTGGSNNSWHGSLTGPKTNVDLAIGCSICDGQPVWLITAYYGPPLWNCTNCSEPGQSGNFVGQVPITNFSEPWLGLTGQQTLYPVSVAAPSDCNPTNQATCDGGVGNGSVTLTIA